MSKIKELELRLQNTETALAAIVGIGLEIVPISHQDEIKAVIEAYFENSQKLGAFKTSVFEDGK